MAEIAGPEASAPLLDLMYGLGFSGPARAAVAARLGRESAHLDPEGLAAVLDHVRADVRQRRDYDRLRDTAFRRMRKDTTAIQSSSNRASWLKIASIVGYDLTPERQAELSSRLLVDAAYRHETQESITPSEMYYLVRGLTGSGTPYDEINAILISWLEGSDAWQSASLRDLEEFVDRLKGGVESEPVKLWRERLAGAMLDRFLLAEGFLTSGFADAEEIADAVRTTGRTWRPGRAADLARAYYDTLLINRPTEKGPPTLAELETLGKLLHNAGLDRSDVVPVAYAEAVLAAFERGERLRGHPLWPAKFLASPMQAEVLRQRLWDATARADGAANLDVGVIAGFTFRLANASDDWVARCQAKANAAGSNGNARSSWLLMLALAEQIEPVRWNPLAGDALMREAIAIANTPQAEAEAAAFLAARLSHQYPGLGDQAMAILDAHAESFRRSGQTERLAELRTEADFWQRVSVNRQSRLAGWLPKLIERRLADLKAKATHASPADAELMRASIEMLEDAYDAVRLRN
ncbi:MAG: hypothetical protein AAF288_12745 [Planctomycetota bacterium]